MTHDVILKEFYVKEEDSSRGNFQIEAGIYSVITQTLKFETGTFLNVHFFYCYFRNTKIEGMFCSIP